MATVTAFIRTTKKRADRVNIRFRLRDGRTIQLFHTSEIEVPPAAWDGTRQEIKAKVIFDADERLRIARDVADRKSLVLRIYNAATGKEALTSEWLETEIDKRLHPEKYDLDRVQTFFEAFDEFLQKRKLSEWRLRSFAVVIRALKRYEMYAKLTQKRSFVLSFGTITPLVLRDIEEFLRNEHALTGQYPAIYEAVPESRTPQPRGQNTINGVLTKIRTFFIWANDVGKTDNNPFKNFTVEECVYGTPFYISIDERNRLYQTNLSRHPALAVQRDIFVFQCLIGCRVGDLYKLTRANVIKGAIEYVPRKTRDGRPVTVRVPLNAIAREILSRYPASVGDRLLPFISEQKYNVAIKKMFLAARLRRPVTVINPTTREPEIRPLNEIASSHLARRCFVGNLYKQVKDPNLVGALSGHKEGSRAFARYREIDEQMKTELVKMLE
jgi:site-specific recombinase XerD